MPEAASPTRTRRKRSRLVRAVAPPALSLLVGVGGLSAAPRNVGARQVASAAEVLVERLDFGRFKSNVETLAGFGTRYWQSEGNRRGRDWIEAELQSYGYAVERHDIALEVPLVGKLSTGVDQVYATKVGVARPDLMYIVSAHMDSINTQSPDFSFAPGADDDGSGTSLVLEVARVFGSDDVETDVSVRFILWNSEEIGLVGSRAYVRDRFALQGVETPPGSGSFPEPVWLGIIQHDMILFDHGLPDPQTGQVAARQVPEADLDVEYDAANSSLGAALELAARLRQAAARYAPLFPVEIGASMCCTDSVPFAPFAPAVSVRENQRRAEIGRGSNPHWHKNSDVFATYRDEDFLLGFSAARMTTVAVAELVGARIR